jgi:hypothetical protein
VFFDDFSQPYTGSNSFQGVDQNKWAIGDRPGDGLWPFIKENVIVKPEGGLYTYGGRKPSLSSGNNEISNSEKAVSEIRTNAKVVRPASSGPRICRILTEWEQRRGYIYAPWAFSGWVEKTANGKVYDHGWEFDLENQGSEYDPVNRTMVAHFNNHTWSRSETMWQRSQQSPMQVTIQLPSDPRSRIMIEFRWRRGSDFYDPYNTYAEWWVENVSGGVKTGEMVRRYHWSPRHILETFRGTATPVPSDAPPADPLPPELASVAPSNNWIPVRLDGNRNPLPGRLHRPNISEEIPSYTWLDVVKDSWSDEGAGSFIWWNGFANDGYFLSDPSPLFVSDYADHHSHVDDVKCFSTVCWGVAVFDPD